MAEVKSSRTSVSSDRAFLGMLGGMGVFLIGCAAVLVAVKEFYSVPPVVPEQSQEHYFQMIQLGEFRRDQFLIDHKTGRIWRTVCSGKVSGAQCDGMNVWNEEYVSGITPWDSPVTKAYLSNLDEMIKQEEEAKKE